jgi:hypothetical protein
MMMMMLLLFCVIVNHIILQKTNDCFNPFHTNRNSNQQTNKHNNIRFGGKMAQCTTIDRTGAAFQHQWSTERRVSKCLGQQQRVGFILLILLILV